MPSYFTWNGGYGTNDFDDVRNWNNGGTGPLPAAGDSINFPDPAPPLVAPPFSVWTAPAAEVDIDAAGAAYDPTGGTTTVAAVGSASHGLVAINADGTIGYTPASGFTGDGSFSYAVEDAAGNQQSNTITVTVAASAPVALDADAATDQDTAVTVSVLNSAFNPAGGTLSVDSVTQGAHGTAAVNPDGTVTYTPASGYAGPDSFQYTVTDGSGNTATGTISITVGPPAADPADAIDSDLAGIQTDLENPDDNTADTVSSIWSASISGAIDAYLNTATTFINSIPVGPPSSPPIPPPTVQAARDDLARLVSSINSMELMRTALLGVIQANYILINSDRTLLAAAKVAPVPVGAVILATKIEVKQLTVLQLRAIIRYNDLFLAEFPAWQKAKLLQNSLRRFGVPSSDLPDLPPQPTLTDTRPFIPK